MINKAPDKLIYMTKYFIVAIFVTILTGSGILLYNKYSDENNIKKNIERLNNDETLLCTTRILNDTKFIPRMEGVTELVSLKKGYIINKKIISNGKFYFSLKHCK